MYCEAKKYRPAYKLKSRRKRKGLIILSVLLFVLTALFLYLNFAVNPTIKKISEEKLKAICLTSVNKAAQEVMLENYKYTDFVEILKDSKGDIVLLQANSALINILARNLTLKSQEYIHEAGKNGIPVPLGSLSGITILSGRGPDFHVQTLPVGTASAHLSSDFESAGINQTLHRILIRITASMTVILPGKNSVIVTETPVIISESVIIGNVPQVYLNGHAGGFLNMTLT